jgi:hypothetical protein
MTLGLGGGTTVCLGNGAWPGPVDGAVVGWASGA